MHPSMGPGMPNSTQIPLALRVLRGAVQPVSAYAPAPVGKEKNASTQMGDKLKGPVTRYSVDFVVAARGLQWDQAPNGGRRGGVEVALVVYDREGVALNWLIQQHDLKVDAAGYAEVQENGVNLHMEIDVPKDGDFLRGGVYDLTSRQAGTLEVPLRSVFGPVQATGNFPKSP